MLNTVFLGVPKGDDGMVRSPELSRHVFVFNERQQSGNSA